MAHRKGDGTLTSSKLFELRAASSLARLWGARDKRTEARDLLAPIYGWFAEGLDTSNLTSQRPSGS